jgi:ribonucleoside-triphosphate reductase
MIKNVIKRDNRRHVFNISKVYTAIEKAFKEVNAEVTEEQMDQLVDSVIEKISENNAKSAKVEEIQNVIEKTLMDNGFGTVAKAFILFRDDRTRARETKSEIIKTIKEITESDIKSSNILRDNANESGATPAGTYGKIASETNKMYNLLNNINRKYAQEHKDGHLHIHDLNQYNLTFNCLFAPVGKLLRTGFDSGTGYLRSPKSIQTAAALTAVILQLQSNQQYGGIADDNLDYDLAPFVDISFKKNLKNELNRYLEYNPDHEDIDISEVDNVSMNWPAEMLYAKFPKICVENAISITDDDTHQAMEGLIGNLNSLQSRSGNQVPFSSLNFGLDISNCGRMVSKNLIKSQYEGLGDGLTAIFPILIFKLMKGYSKDPGDPNYDLYLESIKCLARRFYPNFVSVDSSFNKPYVKYNEKEFTLDELAVDGKITLKYRGSNTAFTFSILEGAKMEPQKFDNIVYQVENPEHVGDYWDITEYTENTIKARQLIINTTVSAMGCRTRVLGNVNGVEQTTGRGNFAFHTINLPRLAIEAHIEAKDLEARKQIFFKKLADMLEDTKESLLDRFALISNKTYENFPFTMQQGLYLTSDDKPHAVTDKIGEVLKQASLSIGYVGLAETMLLLTGKTYGVDHDIDSYAFSIVKTIREFVDKTQKETHLNWSCFATPAEAVAGRFANIDKNLYQNNKKLADVDLQRVFGKGYYTNSHMLDYSLETSLDNKIKMEAPFHKITNAGHIFYYKLNGDLSKNLDAVKATIDAMYEGDLGYFTCTFDSDTCMKCHFHGIIDNECPCCGNKNEDEIIRVRRITGYLTGSPKKSITKSWNDGKLAELKDRVNI